MMNSNKLIEYVSAEPFLPFRIKMASGQIYEIRHPEMILAGRNLVRVYTSLQANGDAPPKWYDVSMMLMETVDPMVPSIPAGN
ncbi:MAG TPA: hypothetical protein VEI07_24040 [Planctomycetaceae bacterium]|nr:hypothetical protein [Planctomycetaceae bacterium]